jgi:hypothetical protein
LAMVVKNMIQPCPIWLPLISLFFNCNKASNAYNNPLFGAGIRTHNHSVVSPLPKYWTMAPCLPT